MNYSAALVQLPLVHEAKGGKLTSPEDVSRLCQDLSQLAQEAFHVLCLNTRHHLVNRTQVWRVRDRRGFPLYTSPSRQTCIEWEQQYFNGKEHVSKG